MFIITGTNSKSKTISEVAEQVQLQTGFRTVTGTKDANEEIIVTLRIVEYPSGSNTLILNTAVGDSQTPTRATQMQTI